MATPLIAIDKVSKSYAVGRALPDVSTDIAAGAFVTLVGTSGSGKTTTLKTINRLIDPDEGEVRLDGQPVQRQPGPLLRRGIGYVFQGVGLFPHLTIGENIGATPWNT